MGLLHESTFFRLCVFGAENTGKTCLIDTLFGEDFRHHKATEGADTQICTIYAINWNKCSTKQIADSLESTFYSGLNATANKEIRSPSDPAPSIPTTTTTSSFTSKLKTVFVESQSTTASQYSKLPEIKFKDIKQARQTRVPIRDKFTTVVRDFADQIQCLSTHTVFIRKTNTMLIVFKASCDLSDFIKARPGDQETGYNPKTTYFDVIHYWLKSVSLVSQDPGGADHMSEFLPTAVLIATHIDEILGDIEEVKEMIIAQLAKELKGKPYTKHLAGNLPGVGLLNALKKYCIFLSNKIRDQNTITKLKEIILQVSAPTMKEKYPLIYLKIEKELLVLKKPMITTTEFYKVAVKNGFVAEEDSMEMKGALDYFHQEGILLHFPSIDGLNKMVFLSPQWLKKLVAYLIIAHHYKDTGDEDDYSCRHLKREGVLVGSFLERMLQMFNKEHRADGCGITFDQAIAFLVKFGFIAEIRVITKFLKESHPWSENEKRIFIVPSQLPDNMEEERPSFVKDKIVWSIYFMFVNGFIPLMVFYRMISACINYKKQSIAWLKKYEIMMVLNHGQYYSISLCKERNSIQLDVIVEQTEQSSARDRRQLINFFQVTLEQTCQEFIPASAKPVAFTPCPHCDELHIKYKNLLEGRPHLCNLKSVPSDYCQNLFEDTLGISTTVQQKEKVRTTLPDLLLHLRPVTKWQKFGVHLLR